MGEDETSSITGLPDSAGESAIRAFVDALITTFGGPEAMAYRFVMEFKAAPEGSNVRQRLMDGTLRLMERYGTTVVSDEATLEELRAELAQLETEDQMRSVNEQPDQW